MSSFKRDNMQTLYDVLSCKYDYKHEIETDENGHRDRNINF